MKQIKIVKSITNRDDRSLKIYFKDIYKYPILTIGEEIELSSKIKEGDKNALNKLIRSNLRFVVTVAKQYQGQGLDLVDLIQEGNIGLAEAAKRYDGTRGFKFISYAVWWIRQSIIQAIYSTSRMIRFPVTQITKLSKINKTNSKLEFELGRPATLDELSKELDMPEERISEALMYNNNCVSADTPVGEGENQSTLGDFIRSPLQTDKEIIDSSKDYEVNSFLSKLPGRKSDIIRMFFGIGTQELSLEEIGMRFGMTAERIRQLKEEALIDIRDNHSNELRELI